LRDIPASIQIVPRAVIKDQGSYNLDQTIRNISGVTQSSSSNYGFNNVYNVRGLRPKFLRDGIPDGPTVNGYMRTLSDVERVEVLKGPGSALFGTSEPGGTINLATRPSFRTPTLNFTQMAGAYNTYVSTLEVGNALTEALSSRLTLNYLNKEGFRNISNTSIEVLPQLTWAIDPNNSLVFNYDYRKIDQDVDTYGLPIVGTTILDVPITTQYGTPFSTTNQEMHRVALRHSYIVSENFFLRTNAVGSARNLYLIRNAGVTNTDSIQRARTLREQTDRVTDAVFQIEPTYLFHTGTIHHTLLGGAEYVYGDALTFRQSANLADIKDIRNPIIPETSRDSLKWVVNKGNDRHIFTNNLGFYLQDQVAITDRIKLRVGVREDLFGLNDIHLQDSLSTDRNDLRFSYQTGIVIQPIDEISLYGGISRGHQSTFTTEGNRSIEPESATQYEIGEKAMLLDGALSINAAVFQIKRENFLVTVNGEPQPVGAQESKGVEFDIAAKLFDNLSITANYSYIDAILTNTPNDTTLIGKAPNGVPTDVGGAWLTYSFSDGSALEGFGIGAGMSYRSDMFFDQKNTITIPGYVLGDATLFYRAALWEAQININNLTDERWYRNGINSGVHPGEPRTVTGIVRLKF